VIGLSGAYAEHCYPGMTCWPQYQEWVDLSESLDGDAIFAWDERYHTEIIMHNYRVTRFPYVIVMAESQDDVIRSVKYANKHRIRITVRSSGHDYIGRATADGSLQINLKQMQGLRFDMNSTLNPAGIVTAESGNPWLRVYNETHEYNRSIVGGSAYTVSMGGYTLGGGHSPIGRKFGMAVDNLLWVTMVAANGSVIIANETHTTVDNNDGGHKITYANGELFWALRGGGGSTFGIVTEFTFKLHYDSKMVSVGCYMPYTTSTLDLDRKGEDMTKYLNNLLTSSLPSEWGGYEIFIGDFNKESLTNGSILLYLNHYGELGSPTYNAILPFLAKYQDRCKVTQYDSFLDYELTAHDASYYRTYIFNVLMQRDSFTSDFYDFLYNLTTTDHGIDGHTGCTGVLIGGTMQNTPADATAVNPSFRTGVMSLTCGMSWDQQEEAQHVAAAERLTTQMLKFGHGTYFNEPSAFLPEWKTSYWGHHYAELYRIKQLWDPANVFSCYHCVGSDENDGLTANPSTVVG